MTQTVKPQFLSMEMDFIDKILQEIFEDGYSFENSYNMFKSSYDSDGDPRDLEVSKEILKINANKFDQNAVEYYFNNSTLVGLDLPVFFSQQGSDKQRSKVMIIALDPLRKFPNRLENVQIATPFALHMNKMKKDNSYWTIVTYLINNGFDVYITDLFKIWMSKGKGKYNFGKEKNHFNEILKREIEILEPDSLITFGNKAKSALSSMENINEYIDFPHPSGAANGSWAKLLAPKKLKCTFANKSNHILKTLQEKKQGSLMFFPNETLTL